MDTRYEVGDALGRGGMGEVRDALDRQIGRRVAIKTIRSGQPSERMIARFLREARIQGRLEHPAIPAVHELGTDAEGRPYFVMKKLAGTTLSKLLRADEPPARQRLLRAFADVCLAVELAHVHGVVHRDLKPDNIVLGDFGEVYVLDWGVAKVVGEDDSFEDMLADDLQTRAGAVLGTPGYMAPEQARGEPIDARADVYSLGVVLHDILDAGDDAPPELRQLCARAMDPTREERVPSARALADGVQRYLDGDRDLSLRKTLAGEHFARARTAFDAADRATAMREAGRAIALDPQLDSAGDLVSRLMLEPPSETPPAVEQELHTDARQRLRASARAALWGFVAFVGFLPNIMSTSLGIALAATVTVAFGLILVASRRDLSPWWVAVAFAPIIGIVARLFSPTLVAPGLAAVIAAALATMIPSRQAAVTLWGLMSAAVLIPLAAERLGWVSTTIEPIPGVGYFLHTPLIANTGFGASVRGALFVVVLVGTGIMIAYLGRRTDEQLRRRLHLQAWQLRQLFPDRAVQ